MDQEYKDIKTSLTFLHVQELRELSASLALLEKGNKMTLIIRIIHFLQTGEKLTAPKFPESSCAKKGQWYPIDLHALMLKGAYKNDEKTRLFFTQLLGDQFHFTAFGIDWLNRRWMEGSPPTYQEFARMWQEEMERRKSQKVPPKEEWAYINFVQKNASKISREDLYLAWEQERQKHKEAIKRWIDKKIL